MILLKAPLRLGVGREASYLGMDMDDDRTPFDTSAGDFGRSTLSLPEEMIFYKNQGLRDTYSTKA